LAVKSFAVGKPFTSDHRIFFGKTLFACPTLLLTHFFFPFLPIENEGKIVSPFHDIPLYADENDKSIVNMVVEIPRWTNGKVEVGKSNPIVTFLLSDPLL
jgi:inorganic pyrophosphatase